MSFNDLELPSTSTSTCPPQQLTDKVMDELKRLGFSEHYTHLASGGFGQVYKVHYKSKNKLQSRAVAVKVSYYKYNKSLPIQIRKFNKGFDEIIAKRVNEHKAHNQAPDSDLAYFTEEMILQPVKLKLAGETKEFTLQFMELIQGKELYDFLKDNTLDLKQILTIFCSCLHALDFFHDGGLMFNDLKLENVMVDPDTFHVTFIDFYDSNTQCTHETCRGIPLSTVSTFVDNFHVSGLHEDVFRLGLLFLDSMTQICHHRDSNASEGLAGDSVKYEMEESSSYPTGRIQKIITDTVAVFKDHYGNDVSCGAKSANRIISEMQTTLNLMLASDITKRPSVNQLLEMEPWKLCAGTSGKHDNRTCFQPLRSLTKRQSTNKQAVDELSSLDGLSTATSSVASRTKSTKMVRKSRNNGNTQKRARSSSTKGKNSKRRKKPQQSTELSEFRRKSRVIQALGRAL